MAKLLLVDDDARICRLVSRALREDGHDVTVATTGGETLNLISDDHYQLVILDLRMPGLDGFAVLRELGMIAPDTPVLVLSGVADVDSRVRCLQMGAADFLLKPFAVAELTARVRARLRAPAPSGDERWLECGGLRLDLHRRRLEVGDGWTQLSHREFVLLSHLMRHPGEVYSRDQLLNEVWGWAHEAPESSSNVVDVCVRRLRTKLNPSLIQTVRNVGYCFAASSPGRVRTWDRRLAAAGAGCR